MDSLSLIKEYGLVSGSFIKNAREGFTGQFGTRVYPAIHAAVIPSFVAAIVTSFVAAVIAATFVPAVVAGGTLAAAGVTPSIPAILVSGIMVMIILIVSFLFALPIFPFVVAGTMPIMSISGTGKHQAAEGHTHQQEFL